MDNEQWRHDGDGNLEMLKLAPRKMPGAPIFYALRPRNGEGWKWLFGWHQTRATSQSDIPFLKQACSILRHPSNPVCGFSMMEHVRLCASWPTENWLGSSMSHMQGWLTVWEWMLQACFRNMMSGLNPDLFQIAWTGLSVKWEIWNGPTNFFYTLICASRPDIYVLLISLFLLTPNSSDVSIQRIDFKACGHVCLHSSFL